MKILLVLGALALVAVAVPIAAYEALYAPLSPDSQKKWDSAQEQVMLSERELIARLGQDHPGIWKTEHPVDYSGLTWLFCKYDGLSAKDRDKLLYKNGVSTQDCQILIEYPHGPQPELTNARLDVTGQL